MAGGSAAGSGMLTPVALHSLRSQWWLVVAPMDLRGGMDRLLVHVRLCTPYGRTALGRDPFDGSAYVLTSFAVVKRLATAADRGSRCCMRMRRGSGYARGDCTRATSSARRRDRRPAR